MADGPNRTTDSIETAVKALYHSDPEREWLRNERHRTEFAVTKRALADYLPAPPVHILDCGGGPGHYAIFLAKMGYQVTLFDLSHTLLAIARDKAAEAKVELVDYAQGSAVDLAQFPEASFDAVLLMGPLYHLLDAASRRQALQEACRVAKPGAPVFVAFISRYAGHRAAAGQFPEDAYHNPEEYSRILRTGQLPPRSENKAGFVAYFTHPEEIKPLCSSAGLEVTTLLGIEGVVSLHEERINALQGKAWDYWVDVNYEIAHDPTILGGVEHILAVCHKPQWRDLVKKLAVALDKAQISYVVVGSAASALHGLQLKVHDLDLEMTVDDVYRVQSIFKDNVIQPVQFRESAQWRSHIGQLAIDGMQVELMAGVERRVGKQWLPSMITTNSTVLVDGIAVRVVTLEEQTLAYLRQSRLDRVGMALPLCRPDILGQLLHELAREGYF